MVPAHLATRRAFLLHPRRTAAARKTLFEQLTAGERGIVCHVSPGQTNKPMACEIDISHERVKVHVRQILSKLKLSSRVEAAVFAVEHRIAAARADMTIPQGTDQSRVVEAARIGESSRIVVRELVTPL